MLDHVYPEEYKSYCIERILNLFKTMPTRANIPCRKYGCKNYQLQCGFCQDHQELVKRIDYREPANKRGYDAAWTKFRVMFLRQHPVCKQCSGVASVVHHIIPLDESGAKYDENNLMSLCRDCHERVHGRIS